MRAYTRCHRFPLPLAAANFPFFLLFSFPFWPPKARKTVESAKINRVFDTMFDIMSQGCLMAQKTPERQTNFHIIGLNGLQIHSKFGKAAGCARNLNLNESKAARPDGRFSKSNTSLRGVTMGGRT